VAAVVAATETTIAENQHRTLMKKVLHQDRGFGSLLSRFGFR
jgi:hypothetical protein